MNGHTEMPTISFSSDATYDTMHSVLKDWCCRIWLTDGVIVTAQIKGGTLIEDDTVDATELLLWSNTAQDYVSTVFIPTDNIRKIEVL